MADTATATTPKKKINRTPLNYLLVAVRKDSNGEIQGFDAVKQPDLSEKKNPSRNDYKRAVRKALEAGENADDYNGKQPDILRVAERYLMPGVRPRLDP